MRELQEVRAGSLQECCLCRHRTRLLRQSIYSRLCWSSQTALRGAFCPKQAPMPQTCWTRQTHTSGARPESAETLHRYFMLLCNPVALYCKPLHRCEFHLPGKVLCQRQLPMPQTCWTRQTRTSGASPESAETLHKYLILPCDPTALNCKPLYRCKSHLPGKVHPCHRQPCQLPMPQTCWTRQNLTPGAYSGSVPTLHRCIAHTQLQSLEMGCHVLLADQHMPLADHG